MHKKIISAVLISISVLFISCQSTNGVKPMIEKSLFGKLPDGREVDMYTLKNAAGMEAKIINYGAVVTSLMVPDRNGKIEDVVLGYDSLKGYENTTAYFGAIVGRYGNRIGNGKFELDGKTYQLTINDGKNHLHGGKVGFN